MESPSAERCKTAGEVRWGLGSAAHINPLDFLVTGSPWLHLLCCKRPDAQCSVSLSTSTLQAAASLEVGACIRIVWHTGARLKVDPNISGSIAQLIGHSVQSSLIPRSYQA